MAHDHRVSILVFDVNETLLERTGIGGYFERSFSVETVRKFKPAPATYRLVAHEPGVAMPDPCLVACHLWDTIGAQAQAQAAGRCGALIARPHNAMLPAADVPVPDLTASTLTGLADPMVQRWQAS